MTRPYKRGPNCSHCDNPRQKGRRVCNPCHAAYMRAWRAKQREELAQLRLAERVRLLRKRLKRKVHVEEVSRETIGVEP